MTEPAGCGRMTEVIRKHHRGQKSGSRHIVCGINPDLKTMDEGSTEMKLQKAVQNHTLYEVKRLYEQSFPAEERKDFSLLLEKQKKGVLEILSVMGEEEEFLGLAITISWEDMTLLDYFAVCPDVRGKGIGSRAFALLKDRYRDRIFLLEVENPGKAAKNSLQRIRRKEFYLRNGMIQIPFLVEIAGVEMEVLTEAPDLTFEKYRRIYEMGYQPEINRKLILLKKYDR